MNTEYLIQTYLRLTNEYRNGLEYMKNNPYITREEVQEHYKVIKEMHAARMAIMKGKRK